MRKTKTSYNNFPNLTYVLFSTIILPVNAEKRFTVAFTRVCSSFSMGKRKQKKLHESENSGHCFMRKRILVKCTINV